MKGRLIVENFGPIKHAEIELAKMMVFIGPQSSGKSTLAKLLAIFSHGDGFMASLKDLLFKRYGISSYFTEKTKIEYEDEEAGVAFSYANGGVITSIPNATRQSRYIPSERSIIPVISNAILSLAANDVPLPSIILHYGADFEKARTLLYNTKLEFLNGVVYKYENEEDRVYHSNGQFLRLSETSSGYQSAIPLILTFRYNMASLSNAMIVVEEPEQNLYPQTQYLLVKDMLQVNSEQDSSNDILLTTHSPYILATLNNHLAAFRVGQKHEAEVSRIIPRSMWISPNDFAAYYVGEGTAKSILNKASGLIDEEYLDEASETIMDEFDSILTYAG